MSRARLKFDKKQWPQFPYIINKQDIPDLKSVASVVTMQQSIDIFERFSSLMKLVRIVAHIFRFFNKLKQRIKSTQEFQSNNSLTAITPEEIDHAIKVLLKIDQKLHFFMEMTLLFRKQNLNKNSPIL